MDLGPTQNPQPLTRPTLETKSTPDGYVVFWPSQRYRNGCVNPHYHNTLGIALQLWNCCTKDLQTILRSNVIVNKCMEPKMLTKMKAVAVRT